METGIRTGRRVVKVFTPVLQSEGVGAKVMRIIGSDDVPRLDPFLMFDLGSAKLPTGFPDHPHRGFETVSYAKAGTFFHEDFKGHKGVLRAGDVQWMTAGKGIVHSEMPASFEEISQGYQLWINLEKKNKMIEPGYQEYKAEMLPVVEKDGVKAKLIAGEALGVKGPIQARTPAFYIDFTLGGGRTLEQHIPAEWNSLCWVYEGSGTFGENGEKAEKENGVLLSTDKTEKLKVVAGEKGVSFILLAGKPIGEPIAAYGPFVMNDRAELQQAMADYSNAKNGFEGADTWESEIQHIRDPAFHKQYVAQYK